MTRRNPDPPKLAGGPGPDGSRSVACVGDAAGRVLGATAVRLLVLRGMYHAGLRVPMRLVAELALSPDPLRG